ncbi:hypothetical protein [Sphingobacterium sp. IITKGP-BTPF85]|uniref:hypothetical protein n=1 Tax=Sphingobacterium sp. IITKGP-BTPF85 TaxID=1338009 RepID=UPI001E52286E|nr:hypothetical protein [Sphingobacterium sp. IITKGP-BTPF85]
MSRSISRSYQDSYTQEQRQQVVDYLSQQRWKDAENGNYAVGLHEVPFDENVNMIKGTRILPETLPANPDPVLASFFDYYRTARGFHSRSINLPQPGQLQHRCHFLVFRCMQTLKCSELVRSCLLLEKMRIRAIILKMFIK